MEPKKAGFFSEQDGTKSMKRLSAFILLFQLCFVITWNVWHSTSAEQMPMAVMWMLVVTILILLGLATIPQVIDLLNKAKSIIPGDKPAPPDGDAQN